MAVSIDGPVGLRWRAQNVTNNARDQEKVIKLLAAIPASSGGKKEAWAAPPLAGPDRSCPRFVVDAIWDFQVFWKAKGVFRNIDAVVDPGMNTLRQMNKLVSGSPEPSPLPTCEEMVQKGQSLARQWVGMARQRLLALVLKQVGEFDANDTICLNALDVHFHIDPSRDKDLFSRVADNFTKVAHTLNTADITKGIVFQAVDETTARADEHRQPPKGISPAYTMCPGGGFPKTGIFFTPAFPRTKDDKPRGQKCAAAMELHESVHFIGPQYPDFVYEWPSPHGNPPEGSSAQYDTLEPDKATRNPSSYASFAQHVFYGRDERFGAGRPLE